ncbi:hypothetical protein TEA_024870 [Camellia sinensis var. sinensis]|uniref:Ribosomal RNA-processing protein 7 C-terminal domain-containing protein n=1 Tax=Camellia sinensis var. sinensis TaxID=542762 RepID=A0A4S4EP97_CAMSN|nr:hypothetical protein TEA_024870 [Camellia sinensis var. sinensis]
MEVKKRNKSPGHKRREREKGCKIEATKVDPYNIEGEDKSDEAKREKKKRKLLRKKKKNDVTNKAEISEVDDLYNEVEGGFDEQNGAHADRENKERKLRKKRRKSEKTMKSGVDKVDELSKEAEDGSKEDKDEKLLEKRAESEQNEVYEISSGDEDCSRGMKKWITEYHQSRPGLNILQQRIDDFIIAYDEQEEQARKESEALAAEGGWTVVVHHKGRKKTTDTESGITVGSVAHAAVLENMAKKKSKDVGLDFYWFQKREAQRNEIMTLQSKFEQDKKRIQQLRAARKFRPY